jgi:hypothetical protein
MKLWQLDIVDGIRLADGSQTKVVTGVDDHSRFCVIASVVRKSTGRATTGKVERFHQTLQRERFDQVEVWPDIQTAQAAIDSFRHEYNTNRPHQSLDMAFPVDRFTPRSADEPLPLRLPATLSAVVSEPGRQPLSAPVSITPAPLAPAPLVLSTNGIDPVNLAVEFTRVVPLSGNLTVCGQQFWFGPDRAGTIVTLWADTTVVPCSPTGCGSRPCRPGSPSPTCTGCSKRVAVQPAHRLFPPVSRATQSRLIARSTPPA